MSAKVSILTKTLKYAIIKVEVKDCMEKYKDENFYKNIYVGKFGNKDEILKNVWYIYELCDLQSSLVVTMNKKRWMQIEKQLLVLQGDVPKDIDKKTLDEMAEIKYTLFSLKKYVTLKKTKLKNQNRLEEITKQF